MSSARRKPRVTKRATSSLRFSARALASSGKTDPPASDASHVHLDREGALDGRPDTRPRVEGWSSDKLAYLIYTSGSTGRPKGVMVEHRNVSNFFVGMDAQIPHDPPGRWLAVTSLSFDISVLELFWTLARGFSVVMSSDADRALVSGGGSKVSKYSHRKIDFSFFYFAADADEHAETEEMYELAKTKLAVAGEDLKQAREHLRHACRKGDLKPVYTGHL